MKLPPTMPASVSMGHGNPDLIAFRADNRLRAPVVNEDLVRSIETPDMRRVLAATGPREALCEAQAAFIGNERSGDIEVIQ